MLVTESCILINIFILTEYAVTKIHGIGYQVSAKKKCIIEHCYFLIYYICIIKIN